MMLSRMADALYWMSRNLERADNTARLLEINLLHLIESDEVLNGEEQWQPLLTITGSTQSFLSSRQHSEITKPSVVEFLTQDKEHPNSIYNCLRLARENARVVRDRISRDMWEALNQTWLTAETLLRTPLSPDRAPSFFARVRAAVAHFQGLSDGTMMGGEAYGFYRLGLFIERSDMTARILDVKYHILLPSLEEVGSPLDYYQWGALLKSLSGFESFRRLYHVGIRPIDVTEFVVFNSDFPRSLFFCVERMKAALDQIRPTSLESQNEHAFMELQNLMGENNSERVFQSGLHEFLQEYLKRIAALNTAVQSDYFEANMGDRLAIPY